VRATTAEERVEGVLEVLPDLLEGDLELPEGGLVDLIEP